MGNNLLERTSIIQKAKDKWDSKNDIEKHRSSKKYKHIKQLNNVDWLKTYDGLNNWQKNILIKGQLIRTYDNLPNKDKTHIMRHFGLSTFSSKWFKLSSADKKILLKSVLDGNEQKEK